MTRNRALSHPVPQLQHLSQTIRVLLATVLTINQGHRMLLRLAHSPHPGRMRPLPFTARNRLINVTRPQKPDVIPSKIRPKVVPHRLFPTSTRSPRSPDPRLSVHFTFQTIRIQLTRVTPIVSSGHGPRPKVDQRSMRPPPDSRSRGEVSGSIVYSRRRTFHACFRGLRGLVAAA